MNLKEKITVLLDHLADKKLEFGDFVEYKNSKWRVFAVDNDRNLACLVMDNGKTAGTWLPFNLFKIIGKPVMIGDALDKVRINCADSMTRPFPPNRDIVLDLWQECGFTKSLNEILGGDIEKILVKTIELNSKTLVKEFKERLKYEPAQNLFGVLWKLFEKEINQKKS